MFTIIIMVEIAIIFLLFTYEIKKTVKEELLKTITLGIICLSSILFILMDFFEYGKSGYYDNVLDLAIADEVMLYVYVSENRLRFGLGFSIAAFAVNLFVKISYYLDWTFLGTDRFFVIPMANLFLVLSGTILLMLLNISAIRQILREATIVNRVHEYVRFIFTIIFFLIAILCFCSSRMKGLPQHILILLSGSLFLFQFTIAFIKCVTNNIFLLKSMKEEVTKIEEVMRNESSFRRKSEADEEKERMQGIYDRIVRLMLEKKPFLKEDFDMDDLSRYMFCNKLYLSKTINMFSGKNFRQFINYYRICHAMEILKREPRKKLAEVAEMSGFHSTATFNMAFKMNAGETPTDWIEEYLAGRYRELTRTSLRPSSWVEQVQ